MSPSAERSSAGIPALLSGTALFLGILIYICIRPAEPRFFDWMRSSGLDSIIIPVRHHVRVSAAHLPEWMVYSLPNALWSFAYAILITWIWTTNRHRVRYFWLATIPVLVLGFELLQYWGIFPGTFCIHDLFAGIVGAGMGAAIGTITTKQIPHENKNQ